MNLAKWERIKLFLLIILIASSLIQVGILWNYKKYGFPNYFFTGFFNKKTVSSQKDLTELKEDLFLPFRVIISQDSEADPLIISKSDDLFSKLYPDMKLYLADILTDRDIKSNHVEPLTDITFAKLMEKPSFTFEFYSNINSRMLPWLLDSSGVNITNKEISGINKIIMIPDFKSESDNTCNIKILDEVNNKIYSYELPFKKNTGMGKDWYAKELSKLNKKATYKSLSVLDEFKNNNEKFIVDRTQDSLFSARLISKYDAYKSYSCSSPDEFKIEDDSNSNSSNGKSNADKENPGLNKLGVKILNEEADNFIPSTELNAAVFKNIGNTYKVYEDGLLEYNYLQSDGIVSKGKFEDAFNKATEFIGSKKDLVKGANIYFSGFSEENDRYSFKFDYRIEDTPVYFNLEASDKDKKILKNAITIEATGDRALSCYWIIKEFQPVVDNQYNVSFTDLLGNISNKLSNTGSSKALSIRSVFPCYQVASGTVKKDIEPYWFIKLSGNSSYAVRMRKK
ncbi:MAG: hypothetical protein Q8942_06090 [Bacillota bacterium]|nr:hypothetical protein [Bacillota bacterium]